MLKFISWEDAHKDIAANIEAVKLHKNFRVGDVNYFISDSTDGFLRIEGKVWNTVEFDKVVDAEIYMDWDFKKIRFYAKSGAYKEFTI